MPKMELQEDTVGAETFKMRLVHATITNAHISQEQMILELSSGDRLVINIDGYFIGNYVTLEVAKRWVIDRPSAEDDD